MKYDATTPLVSLNLPHLAMLVEQAFNIPCWCDGSTAWAAVPSTVGQLAQDSGLPLAKVITRLQSIQALCESIFISSDELAQLKILSKDREVIVLDVGLPDEQATGIAGAININEIFDFRQFFQDILEKSYVITAATCESRALSAALYLKEEGLDFVRCLKFLY